MEFDHIGNTGVVRLRPRRHADERGWFAETFRDDLFRAAIGDWTFVQENESASLRRGTVRGLHFQRAPHAQGKLVRCITGAIFDVAVDLRPGSVTVGRWWSCVLSAANGDQLWVPPGFAHGFCTLEPETTVSYKVTAFYDAMHDGGMAWDDPAVNVQWPECADPSTLSIKDRSLPRLSDLQLGHAREV